MNLNCFREKGTKERKSNIGGQVLAVTIFLHLVGTVAGIPYVEDSDEYEFFGADRYKVRETPKYLKVCHRSDKQIDRCMKASLEKFMESVNSGSQEMNLPTIDPIVIPSVEVQQGSGNVSLHMTVKDLTILGFKHFKIMGVRSNLVDNKFEISMETPYVNILGQFTAEGGVYTFPISGSGDFSLNLTDVTAVVIVHLSTTKEFPGLSYFTVENCIMDLLPTDITAHFGEYIDGSNVIGSAFNTFFNRNAHEIFTLIKPKLSEILASIAGDIANEILSRHPDDVLLPP